MEQLSASTAIQRLDEWEEQLRVWFPSIELLGEIPLTAVDVEEIGQALQAAGIRLVREVKWPHTLLVYMAAVAARNEKVEYWHVLASSLGQPNTPQFQKQFGQLFVNLLQAFNTLYDLPTFHSVGGYRYVTPIRLHGGIPAYSLPDFFGEVVLPAVHKPEYMGVEITELIKLVLERSAVHYFVDSPVRYFLEHGGEAAETFFERCLDMARIWERDGSVPTAQELHLPRYVVQAFEQFMEGQTRPDQSRRLRSPRLLLAPSSGDALFSLDLPEQPVAAEQAGWRYYWRMTPLHGQERLPLEECGPLEEAVRVRRAGYDLITSGRNLPLFLSPCQLRISFEATSPDGALQILGRWHIPLIPSADQPTLAFRPQDGRPVRGRQALPADVLWLLYPRQSQLEFAGEAHHVQSFPELIWDWEDWKIEEWDLRHARSLWLEDEKGARVGLPMAVQQGQVEARLIGENQLPALLSINDVPFFVGTPPTLWLPRVTGDNADREMKAWKVKITPNWSTEPRLSQPVEWPVSRWVHAVQVDPEGYSVPLGTILGKGRFGESVELFGTFSIEIRGPRNFYQELRVRLWPALAIEDLASYYLPGPEGAEPVAFHIRIAPNQNIAVPAGESDTSVEACGSPGLFCVTVTSTSNVASLELDLDRRDGKMVRVPLRVAVPRLRWLLRLDQEDTNWCTTPEDRPVALFLQSQRRNLLLDWTGVAAIPPCSLVLVDSIGDPPEILQELELKPLKGNDRRQNVELSSLHDTLRHHEDRPILTVALKLHGEENLLFLPLLHLKRRLDVQTAVFDWDEWGKARLHWDAPHRLRNRRLRIWSVWRPWEPAREYLVADDVSASPVADGPGGGMMVIPDRLPRGWYKVAFRIAHSWEPLMAHSAPTEDAILCQDGDWTLRAVELSELVDADPESAFTARLELACIYNAVGKVPERDEEIQWLIHHLKEATPSLVVAFLHWLETCDAHTARALRMHMYNPENLRQVFDDDVEHQAKLAYMEGFTATRLIRPESASLVLDHHSEPEAVVHALGILVKRKPASAIEYLLTEIAKGAFSDDDAVELLQRNPEESFRILKFQNRTPARDRLILRIASKVPEPNLIRQGAWVHCEAGWGRIDSIQNKGQELDFCFAEEPALILNVTLRPEEEPEPIQIDTALRTLRFPKVKHVYKCIKDDCQGFISANVNLVMREHGTAAHMGIGPSYLKVPSRLNYRQKLQFHLQPPENQFE